MPDKEQKEKECDFEIGDMVMPGDVAFHPSKKSEWEKHTYYLFIKDKNYEWSALYTNIKEMGRSGILIKHSKIEDQIGQITSTFIPYPEDYNE